MVDLDLEKFFDRVNHDVLMARVARKVGDKRVLRLIRRYLQAGSMLGGIETVRQEGTPQGGPLSPLLSNILLDDLDKELERRGHAFCRYADDCNIYVASKRAGERVMASITRFLAKRLKLTVNAAKSAVDRPSKRNFLGYTMTTHKEPRLRVAPKSVERFKGKLKAALRQGRGRNLADTVKDLAPVLRGWIGYFRLAEAKGIFEELDGWLRRKLRCILWRQWKRPRTRYVRLMQRGLDRGSGTGIGQQRPRPLVECRGQPHERCFPSRLLRQPRAAVTSDAARPPQSRLMNRRVGNPTHGGVGGRREKSRLLPDSPALFLRMPPLRASRSTRSSGSGSVVVATAADVGVLDRRSVRRSAGRRRGRGRSAGST